MTFAPVSGIRLRGRSWASGRVFLLSPALVFAGTVRFCFTSWGMTRVRGP